MQASLRSQYQHYYDYGQQPLNDCSIININITELEESSRSQAEVGRLNYDGALAIRANQHYQITGQYHQHDDISNNSARLLTHAGVGAINETIHPANPILPPDAFEQHTEPQATHQPASILYQDGVQETLDPIHQMGSYETQQQQGHPYEPGDLSGSANASELIRDSLYQAPLGQTYQAIYYEQPNGYSADGTLADRAPTDGADNQAYNSDCQTQITAMIAVQGQQQLPSQPESARYFHYPVEQLSEGSATQLLVAPVIQMTNAQIVQQPMISYDNRQHELAEVGQPTQTYHSLEIPESRFEDMAHEIGEQQQPQPIEYQGLLQGMNLGQPYSEYQQHQHQQSVVGEEVGSVIANETSNSYQGRDSHHYMTTLNLPGSTGASTSHSSGDSHSSAASTSSDSSSMSEDSSMSSSLTRDEKRAREANIPLSYYDIVNLSIDQFNEQLAKYNLSESQLTLIKDIRRRGKNKVAAQSCRKRKMEQIFGLQHEVNHLANKRRSLSCESDKLMKEHEALANRYAKICSIVQDQMNLRLPLDHHQVSH